MAANHRYHPTLPVLPHNVMSKQRSRKENPLFLFMHSGRTKWTHGRGGALLPPPAASNLLCISSHSFLCSFSRLKVFPRLAFSASAASLSRCGHGRSKREPREKKTRENGKTGKQQSNKTRGRCEKITHLAGTVIIFHTARMPQKRAEKTRAMKSGSVFLLFAPRTANALTDVPVHGCK